VNQNRKPAGLPTGGQFANKVNPEPGVELNADEVDGLDELQEWADAGFDPDEAKEWMTAGIGRAEAKQWRDARFNFDEAEEWTSAGIGRAEAQQWVDAGFDFDEAKEWASAGIDCSEAEQWRDAEFEYYEADVWTSAGIGRAEAKQWEDAGFDPDDAKEWTSVGIDCSEAEQWRDAEFDPEEAEKWMSAGIGRAEAQQWQDDMFDLEEAKEWTSAGLSSSEARQWKAAGLTLDVAQAWHEVRIECERDLQSKCGMETSPPSPEKVLAWDADGITPHDALYYAGLVPDGSRASLDEIVAFASDCELVDYLAEKEAAEVQEEINAADLAVWRAERDGDDAALDAAIAERDSILDQYEPGYDFDADRCVWGSGDNANIRVTVDPQTHVAEAGYYETWEIYETTSSSIPPVLGREIETDAAERNDDTSV